MHFGDPRLPERFWAKVVIDGDCWEWQAQVDRDGYGKYRLAGAQSKNWRVHRLTVTVDCGAIAGDMQVDHLCRNRRCCNPAHLEVVTARQNVDRGENYVALNRRKTHCPQGHEYSGWNLVIKKSGSRECRTCRNAKACVAMRRKREAA